MSGEAKWSALAIWVGAFTRSFHHNVTNQLGPSLFTHGTEDELMATALAVKQVAFLAWLSHFADAKEHARYTAELAKHTAELIAKVRAGEATKVVSIEELVLMAHGWTPFAKNFTAKAMNFSQSDKWIVISESWALIFTANESEEETMSSSTQTNNDEKNQPKESHVVDTW